EFAAQDLAGGGPGDGVEEGDLPDPFVGGDALGDVHHDLPLGQAGGGRLAHHVGVRDLVAVLVVVAGHGGVGDTGVGQQQRLQFGGGHLEALVLDQLLDPVDDEQPAGLVHKIGRAHV